MGKYFMEWMIVNKTTGQEVCFGDTVVDVFTMNTDAIKQIKHNILDCYNRPGLIIEAVAVKITNSIKLDN